MGAELSLITSRRAWALRFGEQFRSSAARDPYGGTGLVEDWGEYCSIGPLLARHAERFSIRLRNEILGSCAELGFGAAHTERVTPEGERILWVYDLRSGRFQRSRG